MKNIVDVLKQKEAQLQELQKEVEALRYAMRLLSDEGEARWESRPLAPAANAEPRQKGAVADIGSTRPFP
jgi:hypothetical protein